LRKLIFIAMVAILAWQGHAKYQSHRLAQADESVASEAATPAEAAAPAASTVRDERPASAQASQFRCDGRTHCSQMTSCEQATFFLRNCPDTKMDGDNDGIPCERQWCG